MHKLSIVGISATVLLLVATGCAAPSEQPTSNASGQPSAALTESKTLTVISHESFQLSDELKAQFAAESGLEVSYVAPGDTGTIVNQLILSKDAPLGDVVFGIDNTLAGRAISAGILSPYVSGALPAGVEQLAADQQGSLTPVDYGDICLNADQNWFEQHQLAIPQTLDELTSPEYKGLLVLTNPASSSPGLAWLAGTVAVKGDAGWLDYWKALKANDLLVSPGWTEAYYTEFSGSDGQGPRPLVLSYSSSPMYEVDGADAPTVALTETCVRQVEYVGVVKGTQNEVGARKFVDFMLSEPVQAAIPELMYMSPADPAVSLDEDWEKYTSLVEHPILLDAATVSAQREAWIAAWTETVIG